MGRDSFRVGMVRLVASVYLRPGTWPLGTLATGFTSLLSSIGVPVGHGDNRYRAWLARRLRTCCLEVSLG